MKKLIIKLHQYQHIISHKLCNQLLLINIEKSMQNQIFNNMQEEESKINNPQQLLSKIQRLQSKSIACYDKSLHTVQKFIEKISNLENSIKDGADTEKLLPTFLEEVKNAKPIKSLKDEFNQFYKRLSAFGKQINIEKSVKQNPDFKQLNISNKKNFDAALAEHFLRNGKWKSAKAISQPTQYRQLFQECSKIKQQILSREYDEAISWAQNEKLFETHGNLLQYELKKHKLLIIIKKDAGQAIQYYKKSMIKFMKKHEEELNKLIAFIFFSYEGFWKGDSNEVFISRYNHLEKDDKNKLAQQFEKAYFQQYDISQFDSIKLCYEFGHMNQAKFIQNYSLLSQKQKQKSLLPFSLTTQNPLKYHSLFLCPVSRQIQSSKQGTILLKCGHVVSQTAFNRIVDNRLRRKFKCPVCQEQQKLQQTMQIQF